MLPWALLATLFCRGDAAAVSPEVPRFAVRRWSVDEGLPQASVTAILQARDGYLWLGTFGGLARFDGRTFTPVPTSGPGTPPVARILSLHEGPGGKVWVGTEGAGLLVVQGETLVAPPGLPSLGGESVTAILEDEEGRLWLGTSTRGLVLLEHGRLRSWGPEKGVATGGIGGLAFRSGGGVVAGTPRCVVELPGPAAPTVRVVWPDTTAHYLLVEPDGALLAAEVGGRLRRLSRERVQTLSLPSQDKRGYSCLVRDPQGRVWASLARAGVFRVDKDGIVPIAWPETASESFRCMAADREGNLWLGSDGGGLVQLLPASFRMIGRAEGLPEDVVHPVAEASDGSIWAGVGCSGLVRIRDGQVEVLGPREGFGDDSCIFSLWPRRDGSLVASGYQGALWTVRGRAVTRHPASPVPDPTALIEDRNGLLWVGTRHAGVVRVEGNDRRAFRVADGLPSDDVATLVEDRDGRLLVGTGTGVGVIAGGHASRLATVGDPMPRVVRSFLQEGPRLWVGSYGDGLSLIQDGRLFRFLPSHGIGEGVVSFLHRDRTGHLWWTGNKGVYRASIRELVEVASGGRRTVLVQAFGRADGLATIETNGGFLPPGWVTGDGRLLIPTPRGIAITDPEHLAVPPSPPAPQLAAVLLDGVRVAVQGGEVLVPAGTRRVQVSVTAPTFRAPERLRFWKRLDGFDTAWVDGGHEPFSTFTGLAPGRYVLYSRTSDDTGATSREVPLLTIVGQARFIQRTEFKVVVALAALALAAGLFLARSAAIRRRNRMLSRLVETRTAELEAANLRLERLAGTDDLTGLANSRSFRRQLDDVWLAARTSGVPVSLVMIDVDFFKPFNDALGHPDGDVCLRRVGAQLAASIYRATDIPVRYGGDEFALLMPGVDAAGAAAAAERIRAAVERLAIPHPVSTLAGRVSISAGHATAFPAAGSDPDKLLAAADAALYRAKSAGRNRVEG